MFTILKNVNTKSSVTVFAKFFSTTSTRCLDQKYRKMNKMVRNPNRYGPLTQRPDYSFVDGRPTPIGVRLRARMEQQLKFAKRIVELSGHIDYAVERHKKMQEEKLAEKQAILDRKLKPKGNLLLENKTKRL